MITGEKSFRDLAKKFYDNHECNSIQEFDEDINKINLIKTHFCRFDIKGAANFQLMFNHFISFVNCFGIVSEKLMAFKIPEHSKKVNALFIIIGRKQFDGTVEVDEEFFIQLRKTITRH